MSRYEGGCICKAVRVVIHGEPEKVFACHCLDCQKSAGGPFQISAVYDTANVEVIDPNNKLKKYVFPGETLSSGFDKYKFFCGDCGAPLFNQSTKFDLKRTTLKVALLDKIKEGDGSPADVFKVTGECFIKDRASFVSPIEGVPQYPKGP